MIESLLTFFVGKNNTKRKKIKQILQTMTFNPKTNEYTCKSTRNDNKYTIIYSSKAAVWECDCPALLYRDYKIYETLEDRQKMSRPFECIHILSVRIYNSLILQN